MRSNSIDLQGCSCSLRLDWTGSSGNPAALPGHASPQPSITNKHRWYLLCSCPDTGCRAANSALSEPAAVRTGGSLTSTVPKAASLYGALGSATIYYSILVLRLLQSSVVGTLRAGTEYACLSTSTSRYTRIILLLLLPLVAVAAIVVS